LFQHIQIEDRTIYANCGTRKLDKSYIIWLCLHHNAPTSSVVCWRNPRLL